MKKIILFFCFLASQLFAQTTVSIQLDGSGSMKGFFESNGINELKNQFETACKNAGLTVNTEVFTSTGTNYVNWTGFDNFTMLGQFGSHTVLDSAFSEGTKKSKIIFFVTDNLQTTGNTNLSSLHELFKNIHTLYILPLRLNFKSSFETERCALISYLILIDSTVLTDFEKLLDQLQKNGNYDFCRVKPITEILLSGKNWKDPPLPIDLEEENTFELFFTLSSKWKHVNIGEANPENVKINVSSEIHPFRREFQTILDKGNTSAKRITVNPAHLTAALNENSTSQKYHCTIVLGASKQDFFDLAKVKKFAFEETADFYIDFGVKLKIESSDFSFTNAYKDEWFTLDRKQRNKIFFPSDLIQILSKTLPEDPIVVKDSHDFKAEVPSGYTLVSLAFLLLLIGLILIAVAFLFFPKTRYQVNPGEVLSLRESLMPFYLGSLTVKNVNGIAIGKLSRFFFKHRLELEKDYTFSAGGTAQKNLNINQNIEIIRDNEKWTFTLIRS
ncbi:hypothetical protein IT568_11780 [bacterium]|nr:hypothetical protein [bacterium]